MRKFNLWFDLITFFVSLFMLSVAVRAIISYFQGEQGTTLGSTMLTVAIFLFLAVWLLRASLALGKVQQKRAQQRRDRKNGNNTEITS